MDAVRLTLRQAVQQETVPPDAPWRADNPPLAWRQWATHNDAQLRRWGGAGMAAPLRRQDFLRTVWYESTRAMLQTSLVLGLIQVESAFRQHAISRAGAIGYMQIMPFWVRMLGGYDVSVLFHMQTNVRFGCVILRHYLDREAGRLFYALGRYNGSRGLSDYPEAVMAASGRWALDAV